MQNHILVIDDEVKIAELLQEIVQGEGFRVSSCRNGYDGLKVLQNANVDLIILDLYMVGMNGIDFLRRMPKEQKNVPVIVLTAWQLRQDHYDNLKKEVWTIIDKPVDLNDLIAYVKSAIKP